MNKTQINKIKRELKKKSNLIVVDEIYTDFIYEIYLKTEWWNRFCLYTDSPSISLLKYNDSVGDWNEIDNISISQEELEIFLDAIKKYKETK